MVHYNINWMGPVSMDWFRERGLTHEVSEVLKEDQTFGDLKAGDTWTYECKAGTYKEDSLPRLLWTIFTHRLHHLITDGRFSD